MFIDLCAGGLAGVISRSGVAPLELWKIQSQASYIPDASLKQVLRKEGLRHLWKGNFTNCVRIAPQIAVNFAVFGEAKKHIQLPNKDLNNLACGALSGSASMIAVYPLETVRSRLSLQTNKSHYTGIYDCLNKMKFNEMYRGLRASLIGFTPYSALNFAFYHKFKDYFNDQNITGHANKMLAGGLSGMAAVTFTYPTDLIRRQLQLQGFDPTVPKYNGFIDCTRKIVKNQGIRGLYRGLIPCYVTIFPKFALQFWGFEMCQTNIKKVFT
tara:strand:+ start:414 stop:1220 length:807 start_codon:yes stop_codon:yes gene_type:complete